MTIARRIIVTGRVQGVFFRAWTRQQAEALGVRGWVRNRDDGSVEAHVEGEESAVLRLVDRMRAGPPNARVDDLRIEESDHGDARGFDVRH